MPVLPSGRYVGIMSERARYHSTRKKLRISEKTPHHHLYPLIDILIENSHEHSGNELGFSGYTLADMQWLGQWLEADRNAFLAWVREPAQVQRIEQARRRLLAEPSQPREQSYRYPSRLYSLLRERIAALPMKRATAEQWKRTLLNMTRNGLRREELEWSGVLAFLGRKPPEIVIDKALLLSAVDFSPIQPRLITELECDRDCHLPWRDVAQRLPAYQLQLAGLDVAERDLGVVRYRSDEPAYRVGNIWPDGHSLASDDTPCWFVLGPYGQAVSAVDKRLRFASKGEAMAVAEQHAQRNRVIRCNLRHRNRYEYMSLSGGEDYREWLVTLPNYQHSHFNGHYYERNILLHLRTKVRRSEEGAKVLFVEELQSDWHQASMRYGSRGGVPRAPFRKEWPSLALKLMLLHVVANDLDGIAWTPSEVHEMRYDKPLTPLRRLYDQELPQLIARLAKPWQGCIELGRFDTRHPWLHAARRKEHWAVEGGAGKFVTRARFNQQEALAVIARHSKRVSMEMPLLRLPEAMREYIADHGLPLFGERVDDLLKPQRSQRTLSLETNG